MTLTAEQSSNKAEYEAAPTAAIIDIIRTAMGEGCVRPCHVYDAVDGLICRIQALENRTKRNCDVGTANEQSERFGRFCGHYRVYHCKDCPLLAKGPCEFEWAQMPYEAKEGGNNVI